jgi:hypothetical protein
MLFISYINIQAMHFKSITQNIMAVFPKKLTPWRDLNPGHFILEADVMSTAPRR